MAGWAWSEEEIEQVGARVGRILAGYLGGLPQRPVHQGVPEAQRVTWAGEGPPGTGGLLVSGASMATLTALAVARHRALAGVGVDVRAAGVGGTGPAGAPA